MNKKIINYEDKMNIEIINKNNIDVAHVTADDLVITDLQSAIDLIMTVNYEYGINDIAISKNLITDKFFILSSGLA